jgi:tryptophan halogenase
VTDRTAAAPIRRIVIVGGGTAGWMAAAAVSRLISADVSVTLVESEEIGTVGVGEATIPSLQDFNRYLGIDEAEFMRATGGTFKLGIEFVNWGRIGDRYIHPFGVHGRDVLGVQFHQIWLRQSRLDGGADVGAIEEYCLAAMAAREGRFTHPIASPGAVLSSLRYAFHIDASRYAQFLRRYAEERGVARVEGKVAKVDVVSDTGHIEAISLENGRRFEGDLFIDCSGFRSILLGAALAVPFRSWQHWLPCDRAVAVPTISAGGLAPYTRATASGSGWRWRIPLQHRNGNGQVYASAFCDDQQAIDELAQNLDSAPAGDMRQLRFEAGVRERLWERNCVAIGLSGGFLEPLESTSIYLIQAGISRLMSLLPDSSFRPLERDEYNRLMITDYEQVRDFIILHYCATSRDDTAFWNHCRTMELPHALADKLEFWRARAKIARDPAELFTDDSWIAVLIGQNVEPMGFDPLLATLPTDETESFMRHLRGVIAGTAAAMPAHADYIAQHCAAHAAAATAPSGSLPTFDFGADEMAKAQ